MDLVIMVSDILTILAIVNIILLAVFLFSGHYPLWLLIWQGVLGILMAFVLTVVSRHYKERRIVPN
jgi:hypothetical protein